VTSPGTIALLAIGFGEYLGLQTGTWVSKGFAIVVVLVLTLINAVGVQMGARITNSITSLKVGAMVILVSFGFLLGQGIPGHFFPFLTGQVSGSLVAIGAALVPMAFTYSGWNSTVIVAEEVKNPNRFIPLSLLIGTLATTFIYVLMNAVYLYALPLGKIVGEETVAHLAAVQLFGPRAGTFIKLLVALSVLGCLSASLLTNPRTTFALGRDGLFFRFTGKVHPVYFTPSGAILFQGLWACVLILWGRFDQILILVSVPLVIISAMTILSLFVFRKKYPDHPRPYRCWGYPIVPFLYVLVSLGMLYVKFVQKTQTNILLWPSDWSVPASYCGLAIFVLGVPVFFLWKTYYRARF
jgi:APA family basic amino acid/polyamine antiporter